LVSYLNIGVHLFQPISTSSITIFHAGLPEGHSFSMKAAYHIPHNFQDNMSEWN
jgi:hypothetical protein